MSRKISINAANLNDKVCHDNVRKNYKYAAGGQGSNAECLWPAINWLSTSHIHSLVFVNINHFEIHGNFPQLLYSLNITHFRAHRRVIRDEHPVSAVKLEIPQVMEQWRC